MLHSNLGLLIGNLLKTGAPSSSELQKQIHALKTRLDDIQKEKPKHSWLPGCNSAAHWAKGDALIAGFAVVAAAEIPWTAPAALAFSRLERTAAALEGLYALAGGVSFDES